MAKVLEAIVEINGRDKTGSLFSKIAGKADVADRKMQALGNRHVIAAKKARGMVAAVGELAVGLSAVEVARKSITTYMDLEKTMMELGITAQATDGQIKAATRTLQDQAPAVGQTGQEWGEVAKNLVAAGMGFQDAVGATPAIAKAAKAEGADMLQVSDAANAAMQNLKVGVADVSKALDFMAAGDKAGAFGLKDMAGQFASVAASAQALGFKGTDGVARLSAMLQITRRSTGQAEQAATNLRQAFDKMSSPTVMKAFQKTFGKSLPTVLREAAKSGKNQFEAVLDFISDKTKRMDEVGIKTLLGKVFNDEQARNAVRDMLRFKDDYKKILDQIRTSEGTVATDLGRVMNTTVGKWDRAMASLNRSGAKFGEFLAPGVQGFAEDIEGLVGSFEDLKSSISAAGEVLNGFFGSDNKPGKQTPGLMKDISDVENSIGTGLRNTFGYWNPTQVKMEPKSAPNEPGRGLYRTKSNAQAGAQLRSGLDTAVTGGKLPQPKASDGIEATVPYGLSKLIGVYVDMTKRIEKAYPANSPLLPDATRIDAAANRLRADGVTSEIQATQEQRDAWLARERAKRREAANGGLFTRGFAGAEADRSAGKAAELQAEVNRLVAERERLGLGPGRSPTGPAQPQPPVDVTGKVQLDPNSKASVEVRVKVEGPGTVTGMSASGGGNLKANVGVSMASAHTSRRDE